MTLRGGVSRRRGELHRRRAGRQAARRDDRPELCRLVPRRPAVLASTLDILLSLSQAPAALIPTADRLPKQKETF